VCLASCEYLDRCEYTPVLDVEKVNKTLYRYIPAMEEALVRRRWRKLWLEGVGGFREREEGVDSSECFLPVL